jgi:uncharacterized protein (DUF2141 family)
MIKRVFSTISLLFIVSSLNAQNIEVIIKGLRSDKGQIVIGVFKDNETFQKEDTFLDFHFAKADIKDHEMKVRLSLDPSVYGLSLLDDENSNGKMEYNFLGIPKEGFGFSDYYHAGFKKPKFDAFKFTISPGQKKVITVNIRYM